MNPDIFTIPITTKNILSGVNVTKFIPKELSTSLALTLQGNTNHGSRPYPARLDLPEGASL